MKIIATTLLAFKMISQVKCALKMKFLDITNKYANVKENGSTTCKQLSAIDYGIPWEQEGDTLDYVLKNGYKDDNHECASEELCYSVMYDDKNYYAGCGDGVNDYFIKDYYFDSACTKPLNSSVTSCIPGKCPTIYVFSNIPFENILNDVTLIFIGIFLGSSIFYGIAYCGLKFMYPGEVKTDPKNSVEIEYSADDNDKTENNNQSQAKAEESTELEYAFAEDFNNILNFISLPSECELRQQCTGLANYSIALYIFYLFMMYILLSIVYPISLYTQKVNTNLRSESDALMLIQKLLAIIIGESYVLIEIMNCITSIYVRYEYMAKHYKGGSMFEEISSLFWVNSVVFKLYYSLYIFMNVIVIVNMSGVILDVWLNCLAFVFLNELDDLMLSFVKAGGLGIGLMHEVTKVKFDAVTNGIPTFISFIPLVFYIALLAFLIL